MLDCLQNVLHAHPLLTVDDLRGDLGLGHAKHLLPIHSPDIVHFLQSSSVSRRKSLDAGNLGCEGEVCSSLDGDPPLLLQRISLHLYLDQLLRHSERLFVILVLKSCVSYVNLTSSVTIATIPM